MDHISAMRQHQAVMAWAGCAKETQQFIEKIPDGLLCELLYLCALDGMPLDEMQRLAALQAKDRKEKAAMVWKERRIFLQERYGDDPEREEHGQKLYREIREMIADSEKRWKKLEDGMAETLAVQKSLLEGQNEASETAIDGKEEQLKDLERQVLSLQEQCDKLQKENQRLKQNQEKQDVSSNVFWDIWKKVRRKADADAFIAAYLENKEYSREQKEYLLQCLEEGDSLREIKAFASPGLTIPMMERLRDLNRKPSAGQRKEG